MANTTKKKPDANAPKAKFTVISPLEHDGVLYAIGDEVELTEQQAEPLFGHAVAAAADQA